MASSGKSLRDGAGGDAVLAVDHPLGRALGEIAQEQQIGVFETGGPDALDEKMFAEPGVVGIGKHGHHQVVAFAGGDNVADGRGHGGRAAPDEGSPGEVVAAVLKSLFKGGGRRAEAR